jgi:hypothetical protein
MILAVGILFDLAGINAESDSMTAKLLSKTMLFTLGICIVSLVAQATGHGLLERKRVKSEQVGFWERHFGKVFLIFISVVGLCLLSLVMR